MPSEPDVTTQIIEENSAASGRRKAPFWALVAGGGFLLLLAASILIKSAMSKQTTTQPQTTADDVEQQRYDAQQQEQAKNKASQTRNGTLLLRKEPDSEIAAQVESFMRELNSSAATDGSVPVKQEPATAEEDLIAGVLRSSKSSTSPEPPYLQNVHPPTRPSTPDSTIFRDNDQPMFIYSRSAKYHDVQKSEGTHDSISLLSDSPQTERVTAPRPLAPKREQKDQKPTLRYTEYPPVTFYEGEMLDAVLVNRIIVDTEPSPVICHLSRDLFDNSGQYVVFPANSRILGYSQVVNYKGAHRLFISFHRIILPNGPSVEFPQGSKATP